MLDFPLGIIFFFSFFPYYNNTKILSEVEYRIKIRVRLNSFALQLMTFIET